MGRIRKPGLRGRAGLEDEATPSAPVQARLEPQAMGREVPTVWEGAVPPTFQDRVPPPAGLPGKLPSSPRPWDSDASHTLSCFPHPETVGEPWGCLPSSSLPLHPAWWAAASWGGQLRRRKDNYRQSLGPGLRPGVAAWSAFTPTAWPLKDSLGHRHPNPRQGTTPPLTECPPGLGSVKKDLGGRLSTPHLAGSGHRTAGSLANGPTLETHRLKHGPGAPSRPEGHQAKRMGLGPRVLGP